MTGSASKSIYKSLCEIRQLHKWLWEAVPRRVGRDHAQDMGLSANLPHDLEIQAKFSCMSTKFVLLFDSGMLFQMLR